MLGLKMPGEDLPARVGRDLDVFDLGADVLDKIKGKSGAGDGKKFLNDIIMKRVGLHEPHKNLTPFDILGDVPLIQIAKDIAQSDQNSTRRKNAYRGLSALTHVCVGDIGDVLRLYELIFSKKTEKGKVPDSIQSECFKNYSSNMLHTLNREGGIREYAKSFAEASHEMLVRSAADPRLRQYYAIYVSVSGKNVDAQLDKIRELVDQAVFVLSGGVPRKKTRDQDIFRQFILEYRKIHGLGNFIGLSNRDRFELTGEDLERWLENPTEGKDILLRNPSDSESEDYSVEEDTHVIKTEKVDLSKGNNNQISLFDRTGSEQGPEDEANREAHDNWVSEHKDKLKFVPLRDIDGEEIKNLVLALGFETRTKESVGRVLEKFSLDEVIALEYPEPGLGKEIKEVLSKSGASLRVIKSDEFSSSDIPESAPVLVDITGLSKSIIFEIVRSELQKKGRVMIAYTEAEEYYPLESDLAGRFADKDEDDKPALLEAVDDVVTGEDEPFEAIPLLDDASINDARERALFAFSSAKHKRLQFLLDNRDVDRLEIVIPPENGNRNKVARLNADVSVLGAPAFGLMESDSNDAEKTLSHILDSYYLLYIKAGMNFEFGLTGSKLQAVVCAAASASLKISQCWYVRPKTYDKHKFTKGTGITRYFCVSVE